MATWKLSPQYKKSAVEKMFFYKEGKIITMEQGFRWATFTVESDDRPLTDEELKNDDGYELGCIDNDESWEMWDMIDGCWCDIGAGNDKTTDEDVETFEAAWEEDSYEGVEALGWSQDDCEYYYHGPLELTNEDTGEVFKGEPDEPTDEINIMEMDGAVKAEITPDLQDAFQEALGNNPAIHITNTDNPIDFPVVEKPVVTEWFPVSINPVRAGTYQVFDAPELIAWPFPTNMFSAVWDGKKWDAKITKWRGLANDPDKK